MRNRIASLALSASLLFVASCSSLESTDASVEGFAEMFSGYGVDYEPARSPQELASWSDLVVTGKMVEVIDGREWGSSSTDPWTARTITIVVEVSDLLQGKLPVGCEGRIYVELPSQGNLKAKPYNDALPRSSTILLYLHKMSDDLQDEIVDPRAGRPDGQPMYQIMTPDGFLIEGGGRVTRVIETKVWSQADLTDFLPDNVSYPVDPKAPGEPDVSPR